MKTRFRSVLERVITYSLIALAIVVLIYFWGMVNRAQKRQISSKKDYVSELQKKIEDAKIDVIKRTEHLQKIEQEIAQRQTEVTEKFESVLQKADQYTSFIEQIQYKAKDLGLRIIDSAYNPPASTPTSGKYLEFKLDLSISGDYNNIKRFLWEVENSLERLVKISRLDIVSPLVDHQGTMRMKLTVSTFFIS